MHQDPTARLEADLALVRDVLKGKQKPKDEFARRMRCVPRILAAQNARMGHPLDEHDLADIAQDALVIAWRKLPTFEARATLEGWVYRMCVLEFMNGLKRKLRAAPVVTEAEERAEERAEVGSGSRFDDVHAGLERIPAQEADIVRLKHFEGLTLDAIAEHLELPPSTVRSHYYRGLSRLEGFLTARLEGGSRDAAS